MKRALISAAFLALAAPAMAVTCTSTTSWTGLGPPGSVNFGQTFSATGSYVDCYTFSLSQAATSNGTTAEVNFLFDKLSIDVKNVSLFSGGLTGGATALSPLSTDGKPDKFSFSIGSAGTYTLAVASTVSKMFGTYTYPVGYEGTFSTKAAGTAPTGSVASAAPEGDAYAMAVLGFMGVGGVAMARRRRAAKAA